MQEWTEVANRLFSVPVPGGTIYSYGVGSGLNIVFVPWVQYNNGGLGQQIMQQPNPNPFLPQVQQPYYSGLN